jgi:hypothetical protein
MSSKFQQRRASAVSSRGAVSEELAAMAAEFPELYVALVGAPGTDTADPVPAHSLCLFVHEGRLRFCLSSKESDVAAFGELEDPVAGLSAVEAAIAEGRLGWKTERRSNRR